MIGRLDKNSNQRLVIYNKNKISPTLQAAMGNGGECAFDNKGNHKWK